MRTEDSIISITMIIVAEDDGVALTDLEYNLLDIIEGSASPLGSNALALKLKGRGITCSKTSATPRRMSSISSVSAARLTFKS